MADDPTADVTIRNEATLEERTVPAGALKYFVNAETSWVALDASGRKKANQPASASDSKGV